MSVSRRKFMQQAAVAAAALPAAPALGGEKPSLIGAAPESLEAVGSIATKKKQKLFGTITVDLRFEGEPSEFAQRVLEHMRREGWVPPADDADIYPWPGIV